MIRSIAIACTLTAAAVVTTFLTSSAPTLAGPGGVIDAHENLFAALDRGDAEAASSLFTRTSSGMSMNRKGKWSDSPGSALYLPDTNATGAKQAAPALAGLAERFEGGKTEIVRAWSDCPTQNASFAILEFEHTSLAGETSRYRSTALVRHQKKGFRFYHWHVSPAPAGQ